MSGNHLLSLLGLALRGGRLAVGEEPVVLAARSNEARLILLAADAAGNTLRRAEHLAEEGHCLWLSTPFSKAELGGALGRGSAAILALTDLGLACALTKKLAALDPERYGEAAGRMEQKLRRAKERREISQSPGKKPRRRPAPGCQAKAGRRPEPGLRAKADRQATAGRRPEPGLQATAGRRPASGRREEAREDRRGAKRPSAPPGQKRNRPPSPKNGGRRPAGEGPGASRRSGGPPPRGRAAKPPAGRKPGRGGGR